MTQVSKWTSLAAYHRIKDEGLLSEARWRTYDHFCQQGDPLTKGEVNRALAPEAPNPSYHRRVAELVEMGLLVPTGRARPCRVSGEMCEEFTVVEGALPKKLAPKAKKADDGDAENDITVAQAQQALDELREIVIARKNATMKAGNPWHPGEGLVLLSRFLQSRLS